MADVSVEEIKFEAADGAVLCGDLYSNTQSDRCVLISAGTGFPKPFYRHIARHFAEKGATVLTYDYRGIGASKTGSLRGSQIEYMDWGKDLDAAIVVLDAQSGGRPIYHLAHSVGAHFIGLAQNHARIKAHIFVAVGSGHWRHHPMSRWPIEFFFWWVVGPLALTVWGYIPKDKVGWTGESLPPRVFRTWRKWAMKSTYHQTDLKPYSEAFAAVSGHVQSVLLSDDGIATRRAQDVILETYPNLDVEVTVIEPSDFGLKRIDHHGAFLKGREAIWDFMFGLMT